MNHPITEPKILLNTYQPLCITDFGSEAASKHKIPKYVDGSCRREPDFEAKYPSITALCRGRACAPRLNINDTIIYMTVKHNYDNVGIPHYRLTAILKIIEKFENHSAAAMWYKNKKISIPSNCLIESNPPLPVEKTLGFGKREMIRIYNLEKLKKDTILKAKLGGWDGEYWEKIKKYPVFLVCRKLYVNLENPPILFEKDLIRIFKRVPGTRTPPAITQDEYKFILKVIHNDYQQFIK